MNEIILETNLVKLDTSRTEQSKSNINFDIIDKTNNQRLFEIYTENENLIDGRFSINLNLYKKEIQDEKFKEALQLFVKFIFMNFPIHKIIYTTFQNNQTVINRMIEIGFNIEANLKEDMYMNGKYIDKIILSILRD